MVRSDIFGAACAFLAGALLAWAGYMVQRGTLKRRPERYAAVQIGKQLAQVAYVAALFLLGDKTPWDGLWLAAGGCLGVTVPMIWFTARLVRLNESLNKKEGPTDG